MTDENCGSANHPRDKASTTLCLLNERLLNSRIIRESIGDGFEEYLRLFDAFYANDVEVSSEANAHSGAVEGMNNKIKSISHRSFGFRSAENFIAAIYHCCARLPLPPEA